MCLRKDGPIYTVCPCGQGGFGPPGLPGNYPASAPFLSLCLPIKGLEQPGEPGKVANATGQRDSDMEAVKQGNLKNAVVLPSFEEAMPLVLPISGLPEVF